LLFLEKAELVASSKTKMIHSVSRIFPYPSVIRLNTYVTKPFRRIILSRKNILKRDNFQCAYCGRKDNTLTIDHIIPKAKGGQDTWDNLITACISCNNKKGDRTPEEANLKLLKKPFIPNFIMFIQGNGEKIDDNWKPFIFEI